MISSLRYFLYLLKHKWFVFLAGLKTGAPIWRLLIHDFSKFTPKEFGPYRRQFWTAGDKRRENPEFDAAWKHHVTWNLHHWEHWLKPTLAGELLAEKMPEHFVREMVADWAGAGRAINGKWEICDWFLKNQNRMNLHPETRGLVVVILQAYFIDMPGRLTTPL